MDYTQYFYSIFFDPINDKVSPAPFSLSHLCGCFCRCGCFSEASPAKGSLTHVGENIHMGGKGYLFLFGTIIDIFKQKNNILEPKIENQDQPLPKDKPASYGDENKAANKGSKASATRHNKGVTKIKSDNDSPQKTREKLEYDPKKRERDPDIDRR